MRSASAVAINTAVAASRTRVTSGSNKTNWAFGAGCNRSREDAAALRESADQRIRERLCHMIGGGELDKPMCVR